MQTQKNTIKRAGHTVKMMLTLIGFIFVLSAAAQANTFHVTTAADNGDNVNPTPGSLRAAILQANSIDTVAPHLIDFQIPGAGVRTISPPSPLPAIAEPVVIDGYTQSGASQNTLAVGDNAVLLIELDGTNAGGFPSGIGLEIHGGGTTIRGLVINRFSYYGITMRYGDPGGNLIEGCFIGTDPTGTTARPNYNGINISNSDNNTVGGTTPAARNIISGNGDPNSNNGNGLSIYGNPNDNPVTGFGNIVQGNYIGTNAAGTAALGNKGEGINLSGSTKTTIGGTASGARNVISGNLRGIDAGGANQTLVQGNYFGTDANGTTRLGNSQSAIRIFDSADWMIGGAAAGARNIISGSGQNHGIMIDGSASINNTIQGNYIGTDVTGNVAFSNTVGISIGFSNSIPTNNNKIGGTAPGEGNLISGNTFTGIAIGGGTSANNVVQGNLIGTNAAGTGALPNGDPNNPNQYGVGIRLAASGANLIGGSVAGARNIISGNKGYGIWLGNADNQVIQGNYIGVDINGAALGNVGTGIRFNNDSHNNLIGGTSAGEGNIIAFNGYEGVVVVDANSVNNAINGNAIYSNTDLSGQDAGLGINLGSSLVTPNDSNDGDTGANNGQNYPVITSANSSGGTTTITGTLNSTANTQFRLEFFASAQPDPSGYGEGQFFLGATNVTTVGNDASFNLNLPAGVPAGYVVTATATDPNGNTSEFSQALLLGGVPGNSSLQFSAANYSVNENGATATISVTRTGGNTGAVSIHYSLGGSTATPGSDYTDTNGTLSWASGDLSSKTFTVSILDDTLDEPNETIALSLSNPTGNATYGNQKSAVLTIVDDDATPTVSINDVSVVEGNSGTKPATFTVTLSAVSGQNVTVFAQTIGGGTATSGTDFQAINNVNITFNPGQTTKTVTVNVIGDTTQEPDETFRVNLFAPINATIAQAIGTGTITNDDAAGQPQPTISISDVSLAEGDSGTKAFTFDVTLSAASNNTITVQSGWVAGGTAAINTDFQAPFAGPITFNPGQTAKTYTVNIIGDTQPEPDETFLIQLSNPSNAALAKAQGTGTIINDDAAQLPSTVQFEQSAYTVSEGAHYRDIKVTRAGDVSVAASVDYATSDISANQRTDYTIVLGTLQFASGEAAKTLTLLVTDDSYVEGDESLTLTLTNPVGATLGAQSVSQITIADNDSNQNAPNAIDDVQNFVRQHYHDFLNREPDPNGFQGWQDILNNCAPGDTKCDRIEVSSGFYRSPEFHDRGYFIYRFYSAGLGRHPQYEEFMRDMQKVSGFLTDQEKEAAKQQFIQEFINRSEFKQKYDQIVDAAAFVDAVIGTAGVTLPNRDQIVAQLQANQITRGQALRAVVESAGVDQKFFNESFVIMQYFGYLRRDADSLYLVWIDTLNQTGDYRMLVNGFMNSPEYRLRFGQQ